MIIPHGLTPNHSSMSQPIAVPTSTPATNSEPSRHAIASPLLLFSLSNCFRALVACPSRMLASSASKVSRRLSSFCSPSSSKGSPGLSVIFLPVIQPIPCNCRRRAHLNRAPWGCQASIALSHMPVILREIANMGKLSSSSSSNYAEGLLFAGAKRRGNLAHFGPKGFFAQDLPHQ